jgi:alkanesulfonate monooxygenase SsuD/methylene tetrahydromethanopterin reductase-like flavin-dependent oxidoreductase (luciferase family)
VDLAAASDQTPLRFGVLDLPDAPFETLFERWHQIEELGFDFLFAPGHARHTRDPSLPWLDGLTVLAAMAMKTNRIRIGTLVANPLLHRPSVLAKAAAAIDHLSGGRLELGIGMGVEEFDHLETGTEYWSPNERAARYAEYVEVVDGVLRSAGNPFSFDGDYYRTTGAELAPPPPQKPRPPLIIGSRGRTGRRLAARVGDCWNTYALSGEGPTEAIVEKTRQRNEELDAHCADLGRDPRSVRRSLIMWPPLDPWADPSELQRIIETFRVVGITEFILMWPGDDRRELIDQACSAMTSARSG